MSNRTGRSGPVRRLATVALLGTVLAVLTVGAVRLLGTPTATPTGTASATPATPGPLNEWEPASTPTPTPATAGTATGTAPPPTPPPAPSWQPVARGFAEAFTRRAGPKRWRAAVSRWTTPELAASYATVDPREVPTGTLTALEADAVGESAVDVVATYDTGLRVLIRLEIGPTGWKVTTASRQ